MATASSAWEGGREEGGLVIGWWVDVGVVGWAWGWWGGRGGGDLLFVNPLRHA